MNGITEVQITLLKTFNTVSDWSSAYLLLFYIQDENIYIYVEFIEITRALSSNICQVIAIRSCLKNNVNKRGVKMRIIARPRGSREKKLKTTLRQARNIFQ